MMRVYQDNGNRQILSAFRKTGKTSPVMTRLEWSNVFLSNKRTNENTRISRHSSEIEVTQKRNRSIQLVEKEKNKR